MAAKRRAALGALVAMLALAGCRAPLPLRSNGTDQLAQRRAALAALPSWGYNGRAALSDGKDAVTVRIAWQQQGERYELTLRAPISGETWRLSGDSDGATLEGGGRPARHERDAEALLQRESGYRVPIAALADWSRGLSHDWRRASVALNAEGLAETIDEAGWLIHLRDYDQQQDPPLPLGLEAERRPYRVRLAIAAWRRAPNE